MQSYLVFKSLTFERQAWHYELPRESHFSFLPRPKANCFLCCSPFQWMNFFSGLHFYWGNISSSNPTFYRNLRFDLSLWSRLKSFSSFQVLTVETWTSRIVLSRDAPWADCNFNTCLHSVSCSFRLLFFFFLILKPVIFSYFFVIHLCSLKSICFILSRISQGL